MSERLTLRARLMEVIAALDRRMRHPGRQTEAAIVAEATALKHEAQVRLDALDEPPAAAHSSRR